MNEKKEINILVIGNGFDLYHNLQTGYTDFVEYTVKNEIGVQNGFIRFFQKQLNGSDEIKWIDCESEIARIVGSIPIRNITEMDIEHYLFSIKGYSNSVIGKSYRQIKQAFRIAFAKGIINENVMEAKDIRCPKSDRADKKVMSFTEHEQERFVEALKEFKVPNGRNNYKLQLLIELYSGLRMGEINALKESDIDFEGKVLHVRRTVSRGEDYENCIKEGGKTHASVRDVPISANLEKVLKEVVDTQKKNPEGLLFYNFNEGRIVSTSQVNNFFCRICTKYKLPFYGQHSLRHTFATRCIESGVEAIVLKTWMGHKSIQMTLDIYSDVFNRMHMDSINKFNEYMNKLS